VHIKFRGQLPGDPSRIDRTQRHSSPIEKFRHLIIVHPFVSIVVAGIVLAHVYGHIGPFSMVEGERISARDTGLVLDSAATLTSVIGQRHIVLLIDESGSMENEHDQERLQRYLSELGSEDLLLGQISIVGAGTMDSPDVRNLTYGINKAIVDYPDMQALYVLSDFDSSSTLYWGTDPAQQEILINALTSERVPLYLGTVRFEPARSLKTLALESGGGIIFHQ